MVLSILIHTVEYLYINIIFIGNKLEIYVEHDIKKMEQISEIVHSTRNWEAGKELGRSRNLAKERNSFTIDGKKPMLIANTFMGI